MNESKEQNPKKEPTEFNSLLKDIPKESLKSIFHLIFGKPDSIVKRYTGPFVVSVADIEILNNQINNKLSNHDVIGTTSNITVACSNNMNYEFKDWLAFNKYPWSIPETSESLAIKWEFMVKLPNYETPQRHAVTLRISAGSFSIHFLQAIFSKNPDDLDDADQDMSPMFCRVDFINAILSEEILNIIDSWHKTLKKPDFCFSPFWSLRKYHSKLLKLVHLSFPSIFILAWIWAFIRYSSTVTANDPISFLQLKFFAFWLFVSFFAIPLTTEIGEWLSDKIHEILHRSDKHQSIEITTGDKNLQNELLKKQQNSVWKISAYIFLSILINCFSGAISYWIPKFFKSF